MPGELLRPTFEIECAEAPSDAAARLRDALADAGLEVRWARGQRHAIVTLVRARRRLWSAWLHVDVRPSDSGAGTTVSGRFTPNPALWTAYMLALIALLAIALFAVALALSQITLERPQWGWWILAGALLAGAAMILGSLVAQRLARGEMVELRGVTERALGAGPDE